MQDNSSEQDRPQPGSPAGPEKPPADQSVAAEPAVLAAGLRERRGSGP